MVMLEDMTLMSQIVACSFRVMLEHCYSRGWISEEDIGLNENYYLFCDKTMFSISPRHYMSDYEVSVVIVGDGGYVDSRYIFLTEGGVQFTFYLNFFIL